MQSQIILQSLLLGLANGALYALIGLGFSVIFAGTGIVNIMHGDFAVFGGLFAVTLFESIGVPLFAVLPLSVVTLGVVGWFLHLLVFRPLQRENPPEERYLLLTIGLATLASGLALAIWGKDPFTLPGFSGPGMVTIGPLMVSKQSLWVVGIGIAVTLLMQLFYSRTLLGMAMRASALNPEGAAILGIDNIRLHSLAFVIGGALGALGGVLITPLTGMDYRMGLILTLKGFSASVLGGLANPMGAVLGGLIIGAIEAIAIATVSSGYKDTITLSVLIMLLLFRPNGLFSSVKRLEGV